ncbi:MAG: hypothetical protein KGL39_52600 [Patescibacteria group bacterium]|nr:hypothetical protein [Patescibacteria group bacterium]
MSIKGLWAQAKQIEAFLVIVLSVWSMIADLLGEIGTPVRIVSAAAAAVALVALILQDAILAQTSGGLPAFLTAVLGGWSIISANLGDLGVPVKVVTIAGSAVAIAALIIQKSVATKVQLRAEAINNALKVRG